MAMTLIFPLLQKWRIKLTTRFDQGPVTNDDESLVIKVDECFGSTELSAVADRVLIADGELMKVCRKKPMIRQFFLFNDVLVYGTIVVANEKFKKQRILPLEEVVVEDLGGDHEVLNNGLLLKTRQKSFAVYASSANEKEFWIKNIERCIKKLLEEGNKMATIEHAPIWIPDDDELECMLCRQTKFNIVARRHHCRKCGILVCTKCSNWQMVLSPSDGPVRVCAACYLIQKYAKCEIASPIIRADVSFNNSSFKDNVIKSTTSASAAWLASLRPWTATFYPVVERTPLKERNPKSSDQNGQQASAALEQIGCNQLSGTSTESK